jgi:hypothetical protein
MKLTGVAIGLIIASLAIHASATTASTTVPVAGFGPAYDLKHEITVTGTVQEIVTKHATGSPAGMHLLVIASQGVVDAHIGPFMTKDTQDALHAGTPVQIVGAMTTLHGKDYLLARQLNIGGRTVTIRSEHGFLVVAHHDTRRTAVKSNTKTAVNGGAR